MKNFLKHVEKTDSCWNWTASKDNKGYGNFNFYGIRKCASRVSYVLFVGEIPKGMCVLHKCDNPACVNPEHLFIGTQKDNIRDMIKKKRDTMFGDRSHNMKITVENVNKMRELFSTGKYSKSELGRMFNICSQHAIGIINMKRRVKLEEAE